MVNTPSSSSAHLEHRHPRMMDWIKFCRPPTASSSLKTTTHTAGLSSDYEMSECSSSQQHLKDLPPLAPILERHQLKRVETAETSICSRDAASVDGLEVDDRERAQDEPSDEPPSKDEIALEKFKAMMQEDGLSTMETVKLLYAMGRLSAKLGKYEQALEYHQAELEMTVDLVDQMEGAEGESNEAVAKVLDGMAKLAKNGLGDPGLAIEYHKAALKIRADLYRQTVHECDCCASCKQMQKPCRVHARQLKEVNIALQENRRSMGRILFEEGQVDQAVQMIPRIGNVV